MLSSVVLWSGIVAKSTAIGALVTTASHWATIFIGGAVIVGLIYVSRSIIVAAVPLAMSTFGTVVSGVGTIHASAARCGVAACLQLLSVFCRC